MSRTWLDWNAILCSAVGRRIACIECVEGYGLAAPGFNLAGRKACLGHTDLILLLNQKCGNQELTAPYPLRIFLLSDDVT